MRPEFINRIDNIILFNKLNKEEMKKISNIIIDSIKLNLKSERCIELSVSQEVIDHWVDKSNSEEYGARPLRRIINAELQDPLSEEIIKNDLKNTVVRVVLNSDQPEFIFTGG